MGRGSFTLLITDALEVTLRVEGAGVGRKLDGARLGRHLSDVRVSPLSNIGTTSL